MPGDIQQIGTVPVRTAALALVRDVLTGLDQDVDDAERIDRIRLLEEIKSHAAAAEARETARSPHPNAPNRRPLVCRPSGSGAGSRRRSGWPGGSRRSTRPGMSAGRRS